MFGITGPRKPVIGADIAGEVEADGDDAQQFKVGDRVFGIDGENLGAYAEYVCRQEDGALSIMPTNMSFEEAAAIPFGACTALYFLKDKGDIQRGQDVLINGASGGVGVYAVQLAKYFGAEITAVDSTAKLDMLRSIGADHVVDYTQEDFTQSGEIYDFILDIIGKSSFSGSMRSLKRSGRYLIADPGPYQLLRGRLTSLLSSKKVIFGAAHPKSEDLISLKELIEAGKLVSVIDRRFPLEQTVEAHRYIESCRKKGNVVITIDHD
jgi:NADPH:quinone reductase-like Zn-dependent oxidoreductase